MMTDTSICGSLINFFESNKKAQHRGIAGDGMPNEAFKKSTDMTIAPKDLENEKFSDVSSYIQHLKLCYLDYLEQWDFLQLHLTNVSQQPFTISGSVDHRKESVPFNTVQP